MNYIYNSAIVTNLGKVLRNKAMYEGETLTFTCAKVGAGVYADKSASTLEEMTELKDVRNSYSISSMELSGQEEKIKFLITNFDGERSLVDEEYNANEIGLYAKGNDNVEILYMVMACSGESGDTISPYNGKNPLQVIMTVKAKFMNTENITFEHESAYALAVDLEEEKAARKEADDSLSERVSGIGLATEEEMNSLVEELMSGASPSPEPEDEIATDEEVEEAIENLDDL